MPLSKPKVLAILYQVVRAPRRLGFWEEWGTRVCGRIRVTELKYVVLEPVYQIIREPGWSLRV